MTKRAAHKVSAGPQRLPRRRHLAAPLLALLLSSGLGCAPAVSKDAVPLSGEELKTLIVGNTFEGGYQAKQLVIVFYANGRLRGSLGLTGSDGGTWKIEGDDYCQHWNRYFSASEGCYAWYPRGDGYVLRSVSAFRTQDITGKIKKGKPPGY